MASLGNKGWRRLGVVTLAAAAMSGLGLPGAQAATPTVSTSPTKAAANYTWPKYGYSEGNTGVSLDPGISTANASQLGVKWAVPDQGASESSPVVAHSAALGTDVVYQGNLNGSFTAFNPRSGATLWSDNLGSSIIAAPLVTNGSVWVARTFDPVLYKINADTGAIECQTAPMPSLIYSTPTMATPPGGVPTVFVGRESVTSNDDGVVYAINAANCSTIWSFSNFNSFGGSWDPYSYAVDASGEGLLVLGTDDPDSTVYALDANTGQKVWTYKTLSGNLQLDDVGGGASITAPGVNGFADGAVYINNNGGYTFALNLTTGVPYWNFRYGLYLHAAPARSTPAVLGDEVIYGEPTGVLCLNAVTGAVIWNWTDAATKANANEVLSATSVVGPAGQQVVAVTDIGGNLDVLNAATGALLYQYQTGGYSVTSVADSNGNLYVASGGGFLYDFAVGGSNSGAPTTAVTSPATGSTVANPNGDLAISGTASGAPIAAVNVAIQSGGPTGMWWDAVTSSWVSGFFDNRAVVAHRGATSTSWSLTIPVPTAGGEYSVSASAVATNGQADLSGYESAPTAARSAFTVQYLPSLPHLSTDDGGWVAPGAAIDVTGSGFAANESVGITMEGTTLATVTASAQGGFTTPVTIPAISAFGPAALLATGATSGLSSSATIDVSNQWTSSGAGSLHQSYEPNDENWLFHNVGAKSSFITQAWAYPSGAAIDTSPAIVDDVAYFANNAGTVTALDVQNSEPIWTYSAGTAVDSSPAVGSGLVTFGAGSEIDALSQSTGVVLWQTPTSSPVASSPSLSGSLVYVGSNNGTLYALDTADGSVAWTAALAGAVTGSPSVDPATNEVVVGDASGAVSALNATTGAVEWTVSTGGPVTATPSIYNGTVYVGSGSGTVYALKEATGAPEWTFSASSSVTASGAIGAAPTPNTYVVGDTKGDVYFLDFKNGHIAHQLAGTGAVTGISTAQTWTVATFASGEVLANKYSHLTAWLYQASSSVDPVALVNGVVYLAGQDGALRAFTIPGNEIP